MNTMGRNAAVGKWRCELVRLGPVPVEFLPHPVFDLLQDHPLATEAFGLLPPLCLCHLCPVGPQRAVLAGQAVISYRYRFAHCHFPVHMISLAIRYRDTLRVDI